MSDVLAVDIGGTNLRTGWVTPDLSVRDFEITSSLAVLEVADPSAALRDHLRQFIDRTAPGATPLAASIGFPATIDAQRKVVVSTSNIRSMQNLAIVDYLEAELQVPVVIDKDVNLLLRCDMRAHDLPTDGVVIGCYIGTGLGNAISIDGQLLVGTNGVAGELGHLPVAGLDAVCGCGNTGCIETVASGKALAEIVQREFPGEPVTVAFEQHKDHPAIKQFVTNVAMAIASEINILDPVAVILGGGMVHFDYFPRDFLEQEVYRFTRKPLPAEATTFIYSNGGQQAGVIGAGIYAFERQAHGQLNQTTLSSTRSSL